MGRIRDDDIASTITSCCSSFISLIISISMIAVGSDFWAWCNMGASAYLYHSGIVGLVCALLNFVFIAGSLCLDMCSLNGKTKFALTISVFIAEFVRMIWGFAIIFPAYEQWDYKGGNYTGNARYPDSVWSDNPYFCEYTPFMFAFVILVMEAVVIGLSLLCGCCAGCIALFAR